jgi:hypothetical protein
MAQVFGPTTIRNGLLLNVDAADKKSYPTTSSAGTWYDLSGNNNNGTPANSPGFVSGGTPYMDFTANTGGNAGSRQYNFPSNMIPVVNSFTIEVWLNRDPNLVALGDRESIFSNTGNADGFRFQIGSATSLNYLIGGIGAAGYSEGTVGSGYAVADGKWHQIGMVFDRSGTLGSPAVYSFSDGVIRASSSISSGNQPFTPQSPGISAGCCSSYKGKVARLLTYNRALLSSEIKQNYNVFKTRFGL